MPAMIRDIVDLPNVATAADGTNQLVGVCALFAGAVDFLRLVLPRNSIESILRLALNWEQVNGIVINPFGKYIQMTKKMIELLINGYEYNENERKSKDDENN